MRGFLVLGLLLTPIALASGPVSHRDAIVVGSAQPPVPCFGPESETPGPVLTPGSFCVQLTRPFLADFVSIGGEQARVPLGTPTYTPVGLRYRFLDLPTPVATGFEPALREGEVCGSGTIHTPDAATHVHVLVAPGAAGCPVPVSSGLATEVLVEEDFG